MSIEQQIDEWVAAHQTELLGFLQKLVQTPSELRPPDGHERECQRLVEAAYREAGAEVDVFTPAEVEGLTEHPAYFPTWGGMPRRFENRPDVVGVFKGSGGGHSLLLSTHVDTVPKEPLPWREAEPFSGAIKDGKLYGRGAWDTKWGIAVGLYAMKCLRDLDVKLRGDVIIESVVDEEFGGSHGVLAARLRGYNADVAINSEPTSLVAAAAHRGGGEWKITVRGDAGLAFAGENLSNSVYKLARLIEAVRAYDKERNANPNPPRFYEKDPIRPVYTLQVGGGGATYADVSGIPPECHLMVWVEEHPGTDQATHTERFQSFVNNFLAQDPDFDGIYPEYTPSIRYLPGSVIDPEHPFFEALEAAYAGAGQEYQVGGAPFACDTYMFNQHSPTPCLTLGPRGGNAHAADEFVVVEDLLTLTRIYARAIVGWCG